MLRRRGLILVAVMMAAILAACTSTADPVVEERIVEVTRVVTETVVQDGDTVEVTRVVQETVVETVVEEVVVEVTAEAMAMEEPITLSGASTTDIPTLDPQSGEDSVSIGAIENLFMNLTNYDLFNTEVVPEMATDWEISDDGLVYTFNIRTDVPWVYHNPALLTTEQVSDADGNPMFVTANDFVYSIKRACDPNLGSYYSSVIAPIIVGCADVLNAEDPENITEEMTDAIGVSAPDESTLVIELEFPASYFLSMTPMWTLAASPEMAIAEHDTAWIEAGNIVTNGRYVLNEWVHNVRRTYLRNPLIPADLAGDGNIEKIVTTVVPDASTQYALWLNHEVARTAIPDAELQAHLDTFSDETIQVPDLAVFYFGFRQTKPPMDNVHVRRALSAAFDRATYINEVRSGQGLPMTHFAPPGIFGAPPINEVGIGFDPDFARAEMEAAGYPNCEGFPQVSFIGYSGESTKNWIEFAQANFAEVLGCSEDIFQLEQLPFSELLSATGRDVPDADAPHMWTLGWGPDYADENNWVGDVLWCENDNRFKRSCAEVDDLIVEAREESDQARRIELYYQIEEMFFGQEGEVPMMPMFVRIAFTGVHSWMDYTPALFGGDQIYNYSIDQEAQMEAMGN